MLIPGCIQQIVKKEYHTDTIWFCINTMYCINVRNLFMQPSCNKIVYSDAIGHGFGGYCVEIRHGVAYGESSSEEACWSLTWRELISVLTLWCGAIARR